MPGRLGARFSVTSEVEPRLSYVGEAEYALRLVLDDDPQQYSAVVTAPPALTSTSVRRVPVGEQYSAEHPELFRHPRGGDLALEWPEVFGEYSFVSVYHVARRGAEVVIVHDYPRHAEATDILALTQVEGEAHVEIPGSVFVVPGVYVVMLTAGRLAESASLPSISWRLLLGSGVPLVLVVGDVSL